MHMVHAEKTLRISRNLSKARLKFFIQIVTLFSHNFKFLGFFLRYLQYLVVRQLNVSLFLRKIHFTFTVILNGQKPIPIYFSFEIHPSFHQVERKKFYFPNKTKEGY